MKNEQLTRFLISIGVAILLIVLIVVFVMFDVNLGVIKISSVKSLMSKNNEIEVANEKLVKQQADYNKSLTDIATSQSNFKKEKLKYESISDTTIGIIKEATTQEKYNIEYIWIKLGNYAKKNNLVVLLTEPGGTATQATAATDATKADSTKTTSGTTQQTSSSSSSTNSSSTNAATSQSGTSTNANQQTTSAGENVLKVQVTGNYIDVSDFIFEIENDKELRFKLDNISMEYVGNNDIKTTFSVKNMTVVK